MISSQQIRKEIDEKGKIFHRDVSDDDQQAGTALPTVKEKWSELGPLKLEEII